METYLNKRCIYHKSKWLYIFEHLTYVWFHVNIQWRREISHHQLKILLLARNFLLFVVQESETSKAKAFKSALFLLI